MERSAAYAGILGAIVYVVAGLLPGMPPPATANAADISGYIARQSGALAISAWLTLPAVALIIWFAIGFFDYLRDASDTDRALAQFGVAGAVVWAALNVAAVALMGAATIRNPGAGASFPTLYVFDIALFIFGFGAFGAFAFAAANEGRRRGTMPGWLNAFGYLACVVDVAFTLTIFVNSGPFAISGAGTIVTPVVSSIWLFVASIVLLTRIPKTST